MLAESDVLVCGSPEMVAGTRRSLLAAGVPAQRVFSDAYSNMQYPALGSCNDGDHR